MVAYNNNKSDIESKCYIQFNIFHMNDSKNHPKFIFCMVEIILEYLQKYMIANILCFSYYQ